MGVALDARDGEVGGAAGDFGVECRVVASDDSGEELHGLNPDAWADVGFGLDHNGAGWAADHGDGGVGTHLASAAGGVDLDEERAGFAGIEFGLIKGWRRAEVAEGDFEFDALFGGVTEAEGVEDGLRVWVNAEVDGGLGEGEGAVAGEEFDGSVGGGLECDRRGGDAKGRARREGEEDREGE